MSRTIHNYNEMVMMSALYYLDQHAWLTETTLSAGRHVDSPGHIILIPTQPVFSLTP